MLAFVVPSFLRLPPSAGGPCTLQDLLHTPSPPHKTRAGLPPPSPLIAASPFNWHQLATQLKAAGRTTSPLLAGVTAMAAAAAAAAAGAEPGAGGEGVEGGVALPGGVRTRGGKQGVREGRGQARGEGGRGGSGGRSAAGAGTVRSHESIQVCGVRACPCPVCFPVCAPAPVWKHHHTSPRALEARSLGEVCCLRGRMKERRK